MDARRARPVTDAGQPRLSRWREYRSFLLLHPTRISTSRYKIPAYDLVKLGIRGAAEVYWERGKCLGGKNGCLQVLVSPLTRRPTRTQDC